MYRHDFCCRLSIHCLPVVGWRWLFILRNFVVRIICVNFAFENHYYKIVDKHYELNTETVWQKGKRK